MKWFKQMSTQEQKMLKIGLIIIIPILLWKFVYLPIVENTQQKLQQRELLLSQIKEMKVAAKQLANQATKKTLFQRNLNQPFIAWIDEQLNKNGLSQFVVRSEPKDNKTLILSFENVVFDDLLQWLQPLEQNNAITIAEVDINLVDKDNGLCNARLTLEESQ